MKKEIMFQWNILNINDLKTGLRALHDRNIDYIKNNKSNYTIKLEKFEKTRSINQNSLYWIFITFIFNNQSQYNSENEIHYILRSLFLHKKVKDIKWHLITASAMKTFNLALTKQYKSDLPSIIDLFTLHTKDLKTKEFQVYLDKIFVFCKENFNIELIFPDDARFNKFFNEYKNKSF